MNLFSAQVALRMFTLKELATSGWEHLAAKHAGIAAHSYRILERLMQNRTHTPDPIKVTPSSVSSATRKEEMEYTLTKAIPMPKRTKLCCPPYR